MAEITGELMHVTRYETQDYIEGTKIIDIDKASRESDDSEVAADFA
jgi:hypothetical protein